MWRWLASDEQVLGGGTESAGEVTIVSEFAQDGLKASDALAREMGTVLEVVYLSGDGGEFAGGAGLNEVLLELAEAGEEHLVVSLALGTGDRETLAPGVGLAGADLLTGVDAVVGKGLGKGNETGVEDEHPAEPGIVNPAGTDGQEGGDEAGAEKHGGAGDNIAPQKRLRLEILPESVDGEVDALPEAVVEEVAVRIDETGIGEDTADRVIFENEREALELFGMPAVILIGEGNQIAQTEGDGLSEVIRGAEVFRVLMPAHSKGSAGSKTSDNGGGVVGGSVVAENDFAGKQGLLSDAFELLF